MISSLSEQRLMLLAYGVEDMRLPMTAREERVASLWRLASEIKGSEVREKAFRANLKEFLLQEPPCSLPRVLVERRTAAISWPVLMKAWCVTECLVKREWNGFLRHLHGRGIDVLAFEMMPKSSCPGMIEIYLAGLTLLEEVTLSDSKEHFLNELKQGKKEPYSLEIDGKKFVIPRLMIALFLGDHTFVQHCIDLGLDPNEVDNQGYSAAHFAAMMTDGMLLYTLYDNKVSFEQKTHLGASVYDFLKARGCVKLGDSIFSADALFTLWSHLLKPIDFSGPELVVERGVFEHYVRIKAGEDHFVSPIAIRKMGDGPLTGQWEACASSQVPAASFLTELTGHVEDIEESTGSLYAQHLHEDVFIDAKERGSIARYINHGPPTCRALRVIHGGLPRLLFFTLKPHAIGDIYYHNYSLSYFKNAEIPFYELAPEAIDRYVESTKKLKIFPFGVRKYRGVLESKRLELLRNEVVGMCTPLKNPTDKELKELIVQGQQTLEMNCYLYQFPERLIELIKEKKLEAKEVIKFFNAMKEIRFFDILELGPKYHETLQDRLSTCF